MKGLVEVESEMADTFDVESQVLQTMLIPCNLLSPICNHFFAKLETSNLVQPSAKEDNYQDCGSLVEYLKNPLE